MARRPRLALVMVFMLAVSCFWGPSQVLSSNMMSDSYVGPGKHETELYIKAGAEPTATGELVSAGKVEMWNTKEQFLVHIEPDEDWKISKVQVYVGTDPVPVSDGGAPRPALFPYGEHFSSPVGFYEFALDLEEDLDFSWGRRDNGKRVQNVAVCVKLTGEGEHGKQVSHEEAWAYGSNRFDSGWGWWMRYALDKPMTGHFVDAPVGGAWYDTRSHKGRTDASGAFSYIDGETVTLSIGSLCLGTVPAEHRVTPLDLVGAHSLDDSRVINMARLLQSLDADGDPTRGIEIAEPVVGCLEQAMNELNIADLDFADSELVESLISRTVSLSSGLDGVSLKMVSEVEARGNLLKGLFTTIFRKNISKTPDMETAKAKLELMPVYVPARRANGEPVQLVYKNSEGNTISTRDLAKPLVSVYADEVPGTGAMDVFAAVSRDEGNTWKITNLSRSADKSSFTLANGTTYPGDVLKPNIKVSNNKILVVWTSRYGKSGRPTYAIRTDDDYPYDDEYYEEDIWGVGGPQRSFDYTELSFPEVGELPFYCVWTCRGVISPETGDITWFKPERLTSGRRDAWQIMVNGASNAGFAIVWQEDPKGVRPGEMAGPGHGWSGATTNHKTDVWYSYIGWDDFDKIDENFVSGGDPQHDEDKELMGRPKALVPFKLPVRISDNDTLNSDNMKLVVDENGPVKDDNGNWVVDPGADSGKDDKPGTGTGKAKRDSQSGESKRDSQPGESKRDSQPGESDGSHSYGYTVPGLCVDFHKKINN